jgi:hypothetical protein
VRPRLPTPTHGVEKGIQLIGWVEAGGIGQCNLLDNPGPWLKLPDHVQFFAEAIVLN